MSETTEVKATETPTKRNKRVPFGVPRSKLSVAKPVEGFHLRWINDEAGRIPAALEGGYQFVEPKEVGYEEGKENKVKQLVGRLENGEPLFAYLMKLPMEYYLEDKEIKAGRLDEIDHAIRGGQIDRNSGDGRYVPDGGISYKTK